MTYTLNGHNIAPYANLREVDLSGANLSGANLCCAIGILKLGPSLTGKTWYIVKTYTGPMIYVGCRTFTLKQARDHWNKIRPTGKIGEERQMFLDFIEKWYNLQNMAKWSANRTPQSWKDYGVAEELFDV